MTLPRSVQFLHGLRDAGVRFVVTGAPAVAVHGHIRGAEDLDLIWLRTPESKVTLFRRLVEINARWISTTIDAATHLQTLVPLSLKFVRSKPAMCLRTDIGFLDLFDHVPGIPGADVEQVIADAITVEGLSFASLHWLRRMKLATGRPADLLDVEELDLLHGSA